MDLPRPITLYLSGWCAKQDSTPTPAFGLMHERKEGSGATVEHLRLADPTHYLKSLDRKGSRRDVPLVVKPGAQRSSIKCRVQCMGLEEFNPFETTFLRNLHTCPLDPKRMKLKLYPPVPALRSQYHLTLSILRRITLRGIDIVPSAYTPLGVGQLLFLACTLSTSSQLWRPRVTYCITLCLRVLNSI
ncbi:hypothetical protein NMY22_g6231 [Coprinellus aureogranulatus]|nr:hypothetical protein NMY22_g6231 [Coprinellus aureogranulatus]